MSELPHQPTFEKIPTDQSFIDGYQKLLQEILAIAKGGNPGVALNEVVCKLMPYVQNYNMEYTQGNIANGEKAASYALAMTNYIAQEYQKVGAKSPGNDDTKDAQDAINAMKSFSDFLKNTDTWAKKHGIGDPFGEMGKNIEDQLKNITDNTDDSKTLAKFWEDSWKMSDTKSGGISGQGTNSMIMQDINGAQNQAQSAAAYLQSESKIANENYQQYAATGHDIAQNIVSVEKAAVTASQSAGN